MPSYAIESKEIKKIYEWIRSQKRKGKEDIEIISKNPQTLLLIRLQLGYSQNKFEELVFGKRTKNITKYESGKIKKLRKSTAKKILDRTKIKLKSLKLEKILKNFEKFKKESMGWFLANKETKKFLEASRKGAIKLLEKTETKQEKTIRRILENRNIKFFHNFPLKSNLIVDFYLPDNQIVIECKNIESSSRKGIRNQIEKLMLQAYRVKFFNSKIKVWAVIETKKSLTLSEHELLNEVFDKVFINDYNFFDGL